MTLKVLSSEIDPAEITVGAFDRPSLKSEARDFFELQTAVRGGAESLKVSHKMGTADFLKTSEPLSLIKTF